MHDIASVLLLVSGRKVGFSMMKQLMYNYFKYLFFFFNL